MSKKKNLTPYLNAFKVFGVVKYGLIGAAVIWFTLLLIVSAFGNDVLFWFIGAAIVAVNLFGVVLGANW
jgi:hypothetical protein